MVRSESLLELTDRDQYLGRSWIFGNNFHLLPNDHCWVYQCWGRFILKLVALPIPTNKRIYSLFEGCYIPFYDCIFHKLGVWLPLAVFKIEVLEHLRISPFQLHLVAWAFVKVFQHWDEYKGKMGSALKNLFFHLFSVSRTIFIYLVMFGTYKFIVFV